jgi:hypothetical protein
MLQITDGRIQRKAQTRKETGKRNKTRGRKKKLARKFGLSEMKINGQLGLANTECINTIETNVSCSLNREQFSIC